MKRNHLSISLLAVALLLLDPRTALTQQQVLVYGDMNYPPYSFESEGKPKGIYVDILRSVFAKMPGYDVTMKMTPWKRGLKYVESGEGVAMFPPYYVKERTPWMDLSEPILSEQVVIFGTEESLGDKSVWPEDFFGFKLGLNSGYDPTAMGGAEFAAAAPPEKSSFWSRTLPRAICVSWKPAEYNST